MTEENTESDTVFELGDIVQFKSGSPSMVIRGIKKNQKIYSGDVDLIAINQYDDIDKHRPYTHAELPATALKLVSKGGPVDIFEIGDVVSHKAGGPKAVVLHQQDAHHYSGKNLHLIFYSPNRNDLSYTGQFFDYLIKKNDLNNKEKSDV